MKWQWNHLRVEGRDVRARWHLGKDKRRARTFPGRSRKYSPPFLEFFLRARARGTRVFSFVSRETTAHSFPDAVKPPLPPSRSRSSTGFVRSGLTFRHLPRHISTSIFRRRIRRSILVIPGFPCACATAIQGRHPRSTHWENSRCTAAEEVVRPHNSSIDIKFINAPRMHLAHLLFDAVRHFRIETIQIRELLSRQQFPPFLSVVAGRSHSTLQLIQFGIYLGEIFAFVKKSSS